MKNPLKTFISPYDFAEELPASLTFADLNFSSPVIRPFVKAYVGLAHMQCVQTKTPNFPLSTGTGTIDCYVVEPEDTEVSPAILYCHGGGFMFPLQKVMIDNSKIMMDRTGCRVYLPDYRFAPEDPYPAPFEDCWQTYLYLLDHAEELHIDPDRIAVYGDSAGGALAAAICLKARDEGVKVPIAQLLVYPVTDNSLTQKSLDEFAYGSWSRTSNIQMWDLYLKNGDFGKLSYAAPLQADDFSNLPKAYVEPAEVDALRDEGIAYAEAMEAAGVPVELHVTKGAYHGFDQKLKNPLTKRVLEDRFAFLKNVWGLS